MSASSKKKLRKEQNAASMTQKQQAAAKEAKKLKIYTVTFWVVLALCVSLVAGLALKSPVTGVLASLTTAVEVGEHKVSAVELNYFYIDAINEYCNKYSSWISYILDSSKPLSAQSYDSTTGKTWADNFLDMAIGNVKNTYALYDAAKAAGHQLTEEEQKSVTTLYDNMGVYAKAYNYSDASAYLKSIYGDGASEKSYKEYYEVTVLASSYYSKYSEDLEASYTDVTFRDFEKGKLYEYNSYTYASHFLSVDDFKMGGEKGKDGKVTYSEEEIKAAEEAVKKAAEEMAVADNNTVKKLNAAIEKLEKWLEEEAKKDKNKPTDASKPEAKADDKKEDDKKEENKKPTYSTASEQKDVLYSSVSSLMQEWMRDSARKEGDITFLKYTTKTTDKDGKEVETLKGYYVVLFQGSNDNTYALANVRHILISFEGGKTNSTTGQTTYTDAEKKKAKDKAYAIYDEWLYGTEGATEENFIKLAKEKSTDPGSKSEGGLYEDVYPGQMVTAFNDWCFDENRKPGDHGMVETNYGYHIMYYVSDSETNYRDFMISNDKLSEDLEKWQKDMNDAMTLTEKNTKFVNKDLVLGGSGSHSH